MCVCVCVRERERERETERASSNENEIYEKNKIDRKKIQNTGERSNFAF